MTPSTTIKVHKIAEVGNIPKGWKINNWYNEVLFDSAWTAGVDYDEDLLDDKIYNNEEDTLSKTSSGNSENSFNESDYKDLNKNKLADIMEELHSFNVPNG